MESKFHQYQNLNGPYNIREELEVCPKTIRTPVIDDFGSDSYIGTPRHLLTELMKVKRLYRCRKILTYSMKIGSTVKNFYDDITEDAVVIRRDDRYVAKSAIDIRGTFIICGIRLKKNARLLLQSRRKNMGVDE